MKITSATTRAFRLPLKERMISSKFTMTHRELVLLTVETDAGLAGTGWCTTAGVGARRAGADRRLPRAVPDRRRSASERIWQRLWAGPCRRARWNHNARALGDRHRALGHQGQACPRAAPSAAWRRAVHGRRLCQRDQPAPDQGATAGPGRGPSQPGLLGLQAEDRPRGCGRGPRPLPRGAQAHRRAPADARRQPEVDRGRSGAALPRAGRRRAHLHRGAAALRRRRGSRACARAWRGSGRARRAALQPLRILELRSGRSRGLCPARRLEGRRHHQMDEGCDAGAMRQSRPSCSTALPLPRTKCTAPAQSSASP